MFSKTDASSNEVDARSAELNHRRREPEDGLRALDGRSDPQSLYERCLALECLGRLNDARATARELRRVVPTDPEARLLASLLEALTAVNPSSVASDLADWSRREEDRALAARLRIGAARLRVTSAIDAESRAREAVGLRDAARELLVLEPGNPYARSQAAQACLHAGDPAGALAELDALRWRGPFMCPLDCESEWRAALAMGEPGRAELAYSRAQQLRAQPRRIRRFAISVLHRALPFAPWILFLVAFIKRTIPLLTVATAVAAGSSIIVMHNPRDRKRATRFATAFAVVPLVLAAAFVLPRTFHGGSASSSEATARFVSALEKGEADQAFRRSLVPLKERLQAIQALEGLGDVAVGVPAPAPCDLPEPTEALHEPMTDCFSVEVVAIDGRTVRIQIGTGLVDFGWYVTAVRLVYPVAS